MNLTNTRKRLRAWIDLLTADHKAQGRLWYTEAFAFASEVSVTYNIPLKRVVGVLACLSVQNRWEVNKRDTENLISAFHDGEDVADVSIATYHGQRMKAEDILRASADADIYAMIGTKYAPKTRSFYDNILRPGDSIRVTIDRWILRGLNLEQYTGGGNRYIALYRDLEELFRQEALRIDMRPCALQAALWICIQQIADAEQWEGSRPTHKAPVADEEVPF